MDNLKVINTETGEVVTDQFKVKRVRRLTEAQKENARNAGVLDQIVIDNGGYVFALFKSDELTKIGELNSADMARLLFLGTYIGWEDGKLRADNGGKVYTKSDLPELLGLSRNKAHNLYVKLIAAGVMTTDDSGALYISSKYFYRGDNVVKAVAEAEVQDDVIRYTRIFKATVRFLYKDYGSARTAARLGVLYRILPYLNFTYNIVCLNPQERELDKLIAISVVELAGMLGYERARELTSTIDLMKTNNGQPLFCYFGSSNKRQGMIVNPYTIYAGNPKTLKLAEDVFKLARSMG